MVNGDSTRLRQVLHNLLQNAQDALVDVAEPQIVIRTEIFHDNVQLSVDDNGIGFSEQFKTRAFEPYVTTKSKGTGLGLSIVKKIVEEHGGTIQLKNAQPHGAIVSINLPMIDKNNFLSDQKIA